MIRLLILSAIIFALGVTSLGQDAFGILGCDDPPTAMHYLNQADPHLLMASDTHWILRICTLIEINVSTLQFQQVG